MTTVKAHTQRCPHCHRVCRRALCGEAGTFCPGCGTRIEYDDVEQVANVHQLIDPRFFDDFNEFSLQHPIPENDAILFGMGLGDYEPTCEQCGDISGELVQQCKTAFYDAHRKLLDELAKHAKKCEVRFGAVAYYE
jgi:hypothetical protein